MSEALTVIEKRIADLQKFCQDKTNFLNQINVSIKQLKNEHKLVLKQISEVQGAIQGFTESAKLIKGNVVAPVAAVLDSAPVEAATEVQADATVESEVAN